MSGILVKFTSFTYLLYFIYNHWMNTLDSWKTYNAKKKRSGIKSEKNS